jgi:hypothetical protein
MSGTATEPPSWTAATTEQLSSGEVLIMGVMPPGGGNTSPNSVAFTTTATQLSSLIETGTIVGSETTVGAVATSVPNLPAIPTAGGNCMLQGFIVAQDQVSGDCAAWNIALLINRVPNGTSCGTIGDMTPSQFAATGTLASLGAPVLGANSSGPVISMTGLSGITIAWDFNFSFTEASI